MLAWNVEWGIAVLRCKMQHVACGGPTDAANTRVVEGCLGWAAVTSAILRVNYAAENTRLGERAMGKTVPKSQIADRKSQIPNPKQYSVL